MRIERHVFGSFRGYTTLGKSPAVSTDDARLLESASYAFGQSNDRAFVRSLKKTPGWFTRLLGGGRRGLTRVLEGNPDDNDRPTLRLVTLIISQRDWDSQLYGDIALLLEDAGLWEWDGTALLPPLDWTPPPPNCAIARKSVPKLLALVAQVERGLAMRRGIVLDPDEFTFDDLRVLEMLVPPASRRQFTSGYRSLSAQLPVTVNCPAAEARSQAPPNFRYQAGANHLTPYALFLHNSELTGGRIPVEQVAAYRGFGVQEPATAAAPAAPPIAPPAPRRRTSAWPVLIAGSIILLAATGAYFVGRMAGVAEVRAGADARQHALKSDSDAELKRALAEQSGAYDDKLRRAFSLPSGDWNAMVFAIQKKIADAAAAESHASAAPASDDAKAVLAERDRLSAFCNAQQKRERDRFERLVNAEIKPILTTSSLAKLLDNRANIERLGKELDEIPRDWPSPSSEEKAWIDEVDADRKELAELVSAVDAYNTMLKLLAQVDGDIKTYGQSHAHETLEDVRHDCGEILQAMANLPKDLHHLALAPDEFRKLPRERFGAVKKWLDEQDKALAAATRPAGDHPKGGKGS